MVLGDGYGIIHVANGLLSFGSQVAQLGVGNVFRLEEATTFVTEFMVVYNECITKMEDPSATPQAVFNMAQQKCAASPEISRCFGRLQKNKTLNKKQLAVLLEMIDHGLTWSNAALTGASSGGRQSTRPVQ